MSIPQTPSPLSNIIAAKTYNAAWFSGSTKEAQITAAIAAAVLDGALYVYIPANMLPYNSSSVTFNTAVKMIREGSNHAVYDVRAYGAAGDDLTDDTAAFTAITTTLTAIGGSILYAVKGIYRVSSVITLPANSIFRGDGRIISYLKIMHDGDGIKSTSPINSSTSVRSGIEDLGIVTLRTTNTGGGVVDVGGSFMHYDKVYISGFKYQMILDQTEVSSVKHCEFLCNLSNCIAGLWLVNGATHTGGASTFFTNDILVYDCQFNNIASATYNIYDEGGSNHKFDSNNFNGGVYAIFAGSVQGLTIVNNASEGHLTSIPFTFVWQVDRPVTGLTFMGNASSDSTTYHVNLNGVLSGLVEGNVFGQYTIAAINVSTFDVNHVTLRRNAKLLWGVGRTNKNFYDTSAAGNLLGNKLEDLAQGYVTATVTAGAGVVVLVGGTGLSGTSELLSIGSKLLCLNADGSANEVVTLTAVNPGVSFTANFASNKVANWVYIQQS